MNKQTTLAIGMALGAALMYVLDPERGRRRRALIRDQLVHGAHELEDIGGGFASRARHVRNRFKGIVIETRTRLREEPADDPVLEGRVRSELGRVVADTSGVEISAEHGRVTLRGTAAEAEMESLVDTVQNVPGVHDVINRLRTRENAG